MWIWLEEKTLTPSTETPLQELLETGQMEHGSQVDMINWNSMYAQFTVVQMVTPGGWYGLACAESTITS